jgi:hypothetical protein
MKERNKMKKIYIRAEKKLVPVKNLKNVVIPGWQEYKFFAHKRPLDDGYTVSEESTGCAVVIGDSKDLLSSVISQAVIRMNTVTKERFADMIQSAFGIQKRDQEELDEAG